MSNPERSFLTLADIALIDVSEFERFLPDFVAWFYCVKSAQKMGCEAISMMWTDDGNTGVLTHVDLQTPDGKVERIDLGTGL
jgi:hypothetical protein